MNLENSKKIVILGTGGTIAGKSAVASDNVGYVASQIGVAQLLSAIPSLSSGASAAASYNGYELVCEQVSQLDSKDMNFDVWKRLHERCTHWLAQPQVHGIVITHGTDTMETTARFLAPRVTGKTVILTGAMVPYKFGSSDGQFNLGSALAYAQVLSAGVYVVMNGRFFLWDNVRKNRQGGYFEERKAMSKRRAAK